VVVGMIRAARFFETLTDGTRLRLQQAPPPTPITTTISWRR